jgi:hypothetical protein
MNFEYNGKSYLIPDDEIDRSVKAYHISIKEACIMYLEDENVLENPEQNALCENHYKLKADKEPDKRKKKSVSAKKDNDKIFLVNELARFLEGVSSSVSITNESKLIEFDYNNSHYKLDLVKTRQKG